MSTVKENVKNKLPGINRNVLINYLNIDTNSTHQNSNSKQTTRVHSQNTILLRNRLNLWTEIQTILLHPIHYFLEQTTYFQCSFLTGKLQCIMSTTDDFFGASYTESQNF